MKHRTLPMLHGPDASEAFHQAMKRIARDSTIPKGKRSLGTKRSEWDAPSEPTSNPSWADEIDEGRNRDWSAFKAVLCIALIFALTFGGMSLAAFIFG